MELPAPEMTTAPMEYALVLHSPACRVKSVTMMIVVLSQDTVQLWWEAWKHALVMETWGQDINARWWCAMLHLSIKLARNSLVRIRHARVWCSVVAIPHNVQENILVQT